ncbi:MAG TPA: hypothetical protein VG028_06725 [Terriglobia bacterium]|nr:hypothetical protein [Terriglobia bacterium]
MSTENIDYAAIIADLEAKRAKLDHAISSLRALAGIGTISNSDGVTIDTSMPYGASGAGGIPDGAFHGKTIPEAIRLYLDLMHKKQTAREITDGLKKGGVESTSKKWFDKIIYATLDRLKKSKPPQIVKIGTEWGLPEWYPALMRAGEVQRFPRLTGMPANSKKSVRKNRRGKRKSQKEVTKPGDIAIRFLNENPGPHTAEQIQSATGIENVKVASMLLGTLAKKGKIEKTSDGKYRKAS